MKTQQTTRRCAVRLPGDNTNKPVPTKYLKGDLEGCVMMRKHYYANDAKRKALAFEVESNGYTVLYSPNDIKHPVYEWNKFLTTAWTHLLAQDSIAFDHAYYASLYIDIAKDVTLVNSAMSGIDQDLLHIAQTIGRYCIWRNKSRTWEAHDDFVEQLQDKHKQSFINGVRELMDKQLKISPAMFPAITEHLYKLLPDPYWKTVLNIVSPTQDCVYMGTTRSGSIVLYQYDNMSKQTKAVHVVADRVNNDVRQIGYACARSSGRYKGTPLWCDQIKDAVNDLRNIPKGKSLSDYFATQYEAFLTLPEHMQNLETKLNKEYALELLNWMQKNENN